MSDFLKNALKSRAFKLFLGALAAAAATYAGTGCAGLLGNPRHASLDVLACQVAVLEPYVGDAAAEVSREINGNQAFNPVLFLSRIGLKPSEVLQVAREYLKCSPDTETAEESELEPS